MYANNLCNEYLGKYSRLKSVELWLMLFQIYMPKEMRSVRKKKNVPREEEFTRIVIFLCTPHTNTHTSIDIHMYMYMYMYVYMYIYIYIHRYTYNCTQTNMWVCMLDRMVNCIYVVKLTLGMLIVRRQQHSFSTHGRLFL